jgi:dTMP kinase
LFITFEGGEGCGKSSQAKILYRKLAQFGLSVVLTHEPGGTPFGERISRLLKWGKQHKLTPLTEMILFNASRAQLIDTIIKPNLERGNIVISDRFTDSTLAYQGYGRGLDLSTIKTVNKLASQVIKPDLTILLDMPVKKGLARKSRQKPDRFHEENTAFHNRVRKGFLQLAREEPDRWLVVDARQSKAFISNIVWGKVGQLLRKRQEYYLTEKTIR